MDSEPIEEDDAEKRSEQERRLDLLEELFDDWARDLSAEERARFEKLDADTLALIIKLFYRAAEYWEKSGRRQAQPDSSE